MKRTPLKPGKPLRRKKPMSQTSRAISKKAANQRTPRAPRIAHKRTKPKAGEAATAEQRRYWAWLREEKGCVVTGARGTAATGAMACTIHHVTSDGHKRIARCHWQVVPLRADHHQTVWDNKGSVEAMGHGKFNAKHKVDLLALSRALAAEWRALGCP